MKKNRLQKIVDIISTYEVGTQDELIEYLKKDGFYVTQATVSRDIRELKLTKVTTGQGGYRYVMPHEERELRHLHINHALSETISRVETAQNIIVLHTAAGMAQAVAIEVDRLALPELLGCVAGDDTIIIVARSQASAGEVAARLQTLIRTRMKEKAATEA